MTRVTEISWQAGRKYPLTTRSLGSPEGKEEEQTDEPHVLHLQHGAHVA